MGNYKPLTANDLDNYVKKALELNCPNKILPLLKHHRAFMYYPSKELITQLASFHIEKNDYEGYKAFYDSISRR